MSTDPYHEADVACQNVVREYTDTSSISMATAYMATHAVETGFRALYKSATGAEFPHRHKKFAPHDPEQWAHVLGIKAQFSQDFQDALDQFKRWDLKNVRYEDEQAYSDHVAPISVSHGKYIADHLPLMIQEFRRVDGDLATQHLIVANAPK